MIAATDRQLEPLPLGHPCQGCEARGRAVCGVLGCDNLAEFKKLGVTLRLSAGQTLFREGDPASRVFTLTVGSLKLYKVLPDGRRHIVGFMYPGEFLGISIDDEHAFTAEMIEDSQLCSFPRGRFAAFLADHPAMEHELYRMAAHELSAAQQQLVLVGRKTAAERLATFLLLLVERAEHICGHQTATISLPMSRADIADYLGLTKETVSRILSTFRAARLVRLRAVNQVEIIDRTMLQQVSECEAAA
ncbi:MAG TPA: helix-turn-helix domain-containing protein [Sphingomicrobium sp.]|nr:helix-turn-helix domain-containing protein [Sphingomicrobium sp.]